MDNCTIIRNHVCSDYHGKLWSTGHSWAWEIQVLPNTEFHEPSPGRHIDVVQDGWETTYNGARGALMDRVETLDMEVGDPYAPDNIVEINEGGGHGIEWWEINVKERDYR